MPTTTTEAIEKMFLAAVNETLTELGKLKGLPAAPPIAASYAVGLVVANFLEKLRGYP